MNDGARTPRRFLPPPESWRYHLLLGTVAILVLGPLGGVAAAYMNFSLGFFVGGQVLAGILGSVLTYGYGPDGKHGANYIQTMAASVASMSGMAVLVQAMVWLGMPLPESWKLILFFACIGMFGVGVGMLYTPVLVDRLQLEFPSGHAVANILRALTDKRLLKRSVGKLGGGTFVGAALAATIEKVPLVGKAGLSASTVGAGMIVGSRIAVPALLTGMIGWLLLPFLRSIAWVGPRDSFRKIGFLIALGMILGAAIVDLTLIGVETVRLLRARAAVRREREQPAGNRLRTGRLIIWVLFWGAALVLVATAVLDQPAGFVIFALALTLVFVLVNGISCGISDSNPISSAFVVAVLLMSALGLRSPTVGLLASSVLLIACSVGVDMQQDRSTGWRLGTNRAIQFRYQVIGIAMGAVLAIVLARFFMDKYPVLRVDVFSHPEKGDSHWQSAMTFKFVGAIRDLGQLPAYKLLALSIGISLGLVTEIARKLLKRSARYRRFTERSRAGFATGWALDALVLPSPYASSFGGFVELPAAIWFGVGGILTSVAGAVAPRRPPDAALAAGAGELRGAGPIAERGEAAQSAAKAPGTEELPSDMSTTSLVGGGLIAGESLFALAVGLASLFALGR